MNNDVSHIDWRKSSRALICRNSSLKMRLRPALHNEYYIKKLRVLISNSFCRLLAGRRHLSSQSENSLASVFLAFFALDKCSCANKARSYMAFLLWDVLLYDSRNITFFCNATFATFNFCDNVL